MNLKHYLLFFLLVLYFFDGFSQNSNNSDSLRIAELDNYWREVSRTISEGDFEAYAATFHEKATLVSDINGEAYPIATALSRWKKDFDDTKAGLRKSSVEFRFRKRLGDSTTAHESGIFFYFYEVNGERKDYYINFEGLLVKEDTWKMMMEYQKSQATKEDWDMLK